MARSYDNSSIIPRMAPTELEWSPGLLLSELNMRLLVFFPFLMLFLLPFGDLSARISLLLLSFLICNLVTWMCMDREHSTLGGQPTISRRLHRNKDSITKLEKD